MRWGSPFTKQAPLRLLDGGDPVVRSPSYHQEGTPIPHLRGGPRHRSARVGARGPQQGHPDIVLRRARAHQIRFADACLGRRRGMDPCGRPGKGAEGRDLPGPVPCRDVGHQGGWTRSAAGPWNTPATGTATPAGPSSRTRTTSPRTSDRAWPRSGPTNTALYRAYLLKEQVRAVFATKGRRGEQLLAGWIAWARRSRLHEFVALARTIKRFQQLIWNTLHKHGVSNARSEATNTHIRALTKRAYGYHSPEALIAMAMLTRGGLNLELPGRK